jgi:hypothetical protein
MRTLQSTRINDQLPDSSTFPGGPDLSPALGTWFNCNLGTGEILSLSLTEGDHGLILQAYGAGDPSPRDWGESAAVPYVSSLGSREVSGFTARYDFGFMETQIAANLKYGVLVIQSYNTFRDGSSRPAYFCREFFHQILRSNNRTVEVAGSGDASAVRCRMAGDDPHDHVDGLPGTVDLSPLLGSWRNTYRGSKGIDRVVLARDGDRYVLHGWGIGCNEDWGVAPVVPHATNVASLEPAGFLARYDFGFSELSLAANEAKGLLIIASYSTFRDGSTRSSYFTREFFYRERNDPSS